jgi:hypothetical protein
MDIGSFNVWKEKSDGSGHSNFITGAGGFLQNVSRGRVRWRGAGNDRGCGRPAQVVNGYAGVSVSEPATGVTFAPVLPPTLTAMKLRGLRYLQRSVTVWYNATDVSIALDADATSSVNLCWFLPSLPSKQVPLASGETVWLPVQPFGIAACR